MSKQFGREVLVDLCVQREYLDRNSRNRCLNADHIAGNIKHLMAFARLGKSPILSCVDTEYPPINNNRNGAVKPLRGAPDSRKPAYGLVHHKTVIESDDRPCVPLDIFEHHQQVVFTKVHQDPFTNPKLDRLLTELPVPRFVVFGLPTETSIRILVLGLLRRNRSVALIEDACGHWSDAEAAMVLRQLRVKGCEILTTDSYIRAAVAGFNSRVRRHYGDRSVA